VFTNAVSVGWRNLENGFSTRLSRNGFQSISKTAFPAAKIEDDPHLVVKEHIFDFCKLVAWFMTEIIVVGVA
jgi:hypothetical protein